MASTNLERAAEDSSNLQKVIHEKELAISQNDTEIQAMKEKVAEITKKFEEAEQKLANGVQENPQSDEKSSE